MRFCLGPCLHALRDLFQISDTHRDGISPGWALQGTPAFQTVSRAESAAFTAREINNLSILTN
ncbi:hypothetical protein C7W93_07755 [Glaciimonas sp. PCH181]|nr:hypothetical protein C7W93_07755 [Glaciimonas sp. PCH181]